MQVHCFQGIVPVSTHVGFSTKDLKLCVCRSNNYKFFVLTKIHNKKINIDLLTFKVKLPIVIVLEMFYTGNKFHC